MMSEKRLKELLGSLIDEATAGRSVGGSIEALCRCGFTQEELVEMNFGEEDLKDFYPKDAEETEVVEITTNYSRKENWAWFNKHFDEGLVAYMNGVTN